MSQITILFLAANPKSTPRLGLDEEIRTILEKLLISDLRDSLRLESAWAVRADDLLQYLNMYKPDIVHFSGHGSTSGEILLVNDEGIVKPISVAAIKALFTVLKDNIKVVMLNACYSKVQAQAIAEVINCVIGMNDEISDAAAIVFVASFYRAIGFGRSVQEAFDQGRTALLLEGISEEYIPELLSKKGTNPSQTFLMEFTANKKGGRVVEPQHPRFQTPEEPNSLRSNLLLPKENKSIFNISGKIDAEIVNIGGEQNFNAPLILNVKAQLQSMAQSIGKSSGANDGAKLKFIWLINRLIEQLEKVPLEKAGEMKEISQYVEVLVKEINQRRPSNEKLQTTGVNLKQAGENLSEAMPIIKTIVEQIVNEVWKFAE